MFFIVLPYHGTVQWDEARISEETDGPLKIDNDYLLREDSKQLISLLRLDILISKFINRFSLRNVHAWAA